jgi:SAM-dependent methyltransferase
VLATDLSPAMVAETARRMNDAGLGQVETHPADAEDLGPIGPFDVALCSLGLMYPPDPGRAIGEMARVVRPDGRVVTSVWGDRRQCGWADIFGIVDARVSSDVCPRFFALGAPGALEHVFRTQGLVEVEEHRMDVRLLWADADAALGAAFLGGPVALAYARFDEPTRQDAHAEYLDSIASYQCGDGSYSVPGEFVVVAARTPEKRNRPCHRIEHHHHTHQQGEPS